MERRSVKNMRMRVYESVQTHATHRNYNSDFAILDRFIADDFLSRHEIKYTPTFCLKLLFILQLIFKPDNYRKNWFWRFVRSKALILITNMYIYICRSSMKWERKPFRVRKRVYNSVLGSGVMEREKRQALSEDELITTELSAIRTAWQAKIIVSAIVFVSIQ